MVEQRLQGHSTTPSREGPSYQILGRPGEKSIVLPGVQIIYPSSGKHFYLMFLPAISYSRSYPFDALLNTHRALHRPSTSTCMLLLELKRYKDTVNCVALGAEVP